MPNYNSVQLMGNLTRDVELKAMGNSGSVCKFGMAINRTFKGVDGKQKKETTFVDVNMFGRRAEVISEYFSKGDSIFIEGRLKLEQWESQGGEKRSKLVVIADNFEFLGGKQAESQQKSGRNLAETPTPDDDDINNPPF